MLVLFALLIVPVALILTVGSIIDQHDALRHAVEDRQSQAAEAAAHSLDRLLIRGGASLELTGANATSVLLAANVTLLEPMLHDTLNDSQVLSALAIVGPGDALLAMANRSHVPVGPVGPEGVPWWADESDLHWVLPLGIPDHRLVALLDERVLQEAVEPLTRSYRSVYLVADKDRPMLWTGSEEPPTLEELPGPTGAWSGSRFVNSASVERGLHVVMVNDGRPLSRDQMVIVRDSLVATGTLLTTVFLIAFFGAGIVTKPLRQVEEAAKRRGMGEAGVRAEATGAVQEVRELAESFNRMADALDAEHQELLDLQRDLEERVEQRTLALQQRNRELDDFAHTVSHDLKAPLRGIGLMARLVETSEPDLSEASRQHLQKVHARIRQMEAMIESLLEYARAGIPEEPLQEVHVRGLVEELWSMLPTPPNMRLHIGSWMPVLHTYPVLLRQVLQNLIGNAIMHHHRQEDGNIWIRASARQDHILFVVEDDGPGIPPLRRKHLFDPFHESTRPGGGHGVGLAIVKKIVQGQGYEVQATARRGGGTRFTFRWPKEAPF